jgi:ApbE superfamily uncharacterized protein (UPF0280 family)
VRTAAIAWPAARSAWLPDGRLHLQDGPIDLVIDAMGPAPVRERALAAACLAFEGVLAGLCRHLVELRRPVDGGWPLDATPTAQRMRAAVARFEPTFVTPMAAVAGSVADTVLAAMVRVPGLDSAYVNNRGDIALHVTPQRPLEIGIVPMLAEAGVGAALRIEARHGIGGIATSGWDGRSFSLGIADAVTVLAKDAATADAAATLIANAVDADHPAIERMRACDLDPDSDLGERPVTTAVGALPGATVDAALAKGAALAARWIDRDHIEAAFLALQGRVAILPRDQEFVLEGTRT